MTEIPRWAFERMEQERAAHYGAVANPKNVDIFMADPTGWACYWMFAAYIARHEQPPEPALVLSRKCVICNGSGECTGPYRTCGACNGSGVMR